MFEGKINTKTLEGLALSECADVLESTGLGTTTKIGMLMVLQQLYMESA